MSRRYGRGGWFATGAGLSGLVCALIGWIAAASFARVGP